MGPNVGALGRLVGVCKPMPSRREKLLAKAVSMVFSEELIIVEKTGSRISGVNGKSDEVNDAVSTPWDTLVEAGEFGVGGIGRLGGGRGCASWVLRIPLASVGRLIGTEGGDGNNDSERSDPVVIELSEPR